MHSKSDGFAQSMYFHATDFETVERVAELARQRGVSMTQIALAWLLHKPVVTAPIIGASKMNHLEEAVAALEIQFSQDEIKFLEERYQPHPVLGYS